VVEEEAQRLGARNTRLVAWGPELSSPLYARETSEDLGVVSAGKSGRDLKTLAVALRVTAQLAVIYDTERQLAEAPEHVRIVRGGGEGADPDAPATYLPARVLADMARASVVAIPARVTTGLIGLTEVNDALALAKPIVMTRVPSFPFDIEEVGCGLLVAPGDVEGWVRALRQLSDPGLRREMGQQGRRFAEREWNYTRFCDVVVETVGRL
jgi:glycosyltransferase involved in cell wall biosynthesis